MSTEIKGKVFAIVAPLTGESAKGPWKKQEFVIETMDQYPKKVCFTVWNDKAGIPQVGQECTVFFNAESREYNGRYYTDLGAWKIEAGEASDNVPPPDLLAEQKPQEDGLPF